VCPAQPPLQHARHRIRASFEAKRSDAQSLPLGALALCAGLLLAVVYLSELAGVLKLKLPGAGGWALVLGFRALPVIAGPTLQRAAARIDGRLKATRGSAIGGVSERPE
jgi:hypothetical protein